MFIVFLRQREIRVTAVRARTEQLAAGSVEPNTLARVLMAGKERHAQKVHILVCLTV